MLERLLSGFVMPGTPEFTIAVIGTNLFFIGIIVLFVCIIKKLM